MKDDGILNMAAKETIGKEWNDYLSPHAHGPVFQTRHNCIGDEVLPGSAIRTLYKGLKVIRQDPFLDPLARHRVRRVTAFCSLGMPVFACRPLAYDEEIIASKNRPLSSDKLFHRMVSAAFSNMLLRTLKQDTQVMEALEFAALPQPLRFRQLFLLLVTQEKTWHDRLRETCSAAEIGRLLEHLERYITQLASRL